jgi:hypothetical protein
MTERTSDEEDMADYTDDHQDETKDGRPTPGDGGTTHEIAPDVDTPGQEPPD